MQKLADFQAGFSRAILDHEDEAATPFIDAAGMPPEIRLRVYRNNVFSSLIEALRALYPAVEGNMGAEAFRISGRHYLEQERPRSGRLAEFGHAFPEFLSRFEPTSNQPVLAELATVELAWHQAYRAAETTPLSATDLAEIAPEDMARLQFTLPPSACLVECGHAAGQIWQAWQNDRRAMADEIKAADHLLVIRPNADVEVRFLSAGGFAFLQHLDGGETLVAAFEAATEAEPTFDLQQTLQDFISGRTFMSFHIDNHQN